MMMTVRKFDSKLLVNWCRHFVHLSPKFYSGS